MAKIGVHTGPTNIRRLKETGAFIMSWPADAAASTADAAAYNPTITAFESPIPRPGVLDPIEDWIAYVLYLDSFALVEGLTKPALIALADTLELVN